MVELCGLKQESKGAPTPITKATGKRRRDIDDNWEPHDVQTFRQAASTGFYSIDRPSLQFAMSVVMSGMSDPKVVHRLQVVRVARYVLQHPGETWLFNYQADPKTLYVYTDTGLGSGRADQGSLCRALWRGMAATCLTVASRKNHWLHCRPERQSFTALSGPWQRQSKPHRSWSRSGCNWR